MFIYILPFSIQSSHICVCLNPESVSIGICRGRFCVCGQWLEVGRTCSFYWWEYWPSLFKFLFTKMLSIQMLNSIHWNYASIWKRWHFFPKAFFFSQQLYHRTWIHPHFCERLCFINCFPFLLVLCDLKIHIWLYCIHLRNYI